MRATFDASVSAPTVAVAVITSSPARRPWYANRRNAARGRAREVSLFVRAADLHFEEHRRAGWHVDTLRNVAASDCEPPCVGFGDTERGVRPSDGDGLVAAKSQAPASGAIL